jgi:glycosyltransferase involved in cell wall biosynthesis
MSEDRLASIVISSYNYDRYLRAALDSALAQEYDNKEIIVVDDGSSDHSREIIASYGDRVVAVLKDNGGQASAFNAGVARSAGEVVLFLDSDDVLLPTALLQAMPCFDDPLVSKVHWPLRLIDESGRPGKRTVPASPVDEGDLAGTVARSGPGGYNWPPTSGNAWSRRFLDCVSPIPEQDYKVCPDLYLCALAPLYGTVRKIDEPQGFWRVHGDNAGWRQPLDERVRHQIGLWDNCIAAMQAHAGKRGIRVDPQTLKAGSWWHRIGQTIDDIKALLPGGGSLILVDEDQWGPGGSIAGRTRIPFPEHNGRFHGLPANDEEAIRETERLRDSGAQMMAFVWPAFWWLEHYTGLNRYLRSAYPCLVENDRLVVFDLRPAQGGEAERRGGPA